MADEEAICKPGAVIYCARLWQGADTPKVRCDVMRLVAERGLERDVVSFYEAVRLLAAAIADPIERSLAAQDLVTAVVDASAATRLGGVKFQLLEMARSMYLSMSPRSLGEQVHVSTFFDTQLALFNACLCVAAASCEKQDMVRARDMIAKIREDHRAIPNVRGWCWRRLWEATGDIHDAERYVEAGGSWEGLGFRDLAEARASVVARMRSEPVAACG